MSRIRPVLSALVVGALVLAGCSRGAEEAPAPAPAPPEPDVVEDEPEPAEPDEPAEPAGFAPLTGLPLDDDVAADLAVRPLLIVKIDNSPPARPQTGLDVADVVIEELVEGGITRFVSLFHSTLPDTVGPVRSGRPVDAQLASGFPVPVFAYSGARPEVQSLLRSAPIVTVEEGSSGFSRVADRRAPHDLFLSPADVLAAGLDRGAEPLGDAGLVFDEAVPDGAATCPEPDADADAPDGDDGGDGAACDDPGAGLSVTMSRANVTTWTYDEDEGVYRREQGGSATEVTGDGQVGAANVVVLATRHFTGGCCDSGGNPYPETEVVGGDRAVVLRDGRRFEARWSKDAADAPLELTTPDGDPFPLRPGPTWMLLPPASALPAEPA